MNYMNIAIDIARNNPISTFHRRASCMSGFGAVLTNGKRVYLGENQNKTHPLQKRFQPNPWAIYLHAEIDCIRKALSDGVQDFSSYEIYVARVTKTGIIGYAHPCQGCMKAIRYFGIGKVYWTC